MNHTCDRSVHFSCGHKTVSNKTNFFYFFLCVKRESFSPLSLSLSFSLFFLWTHLLSFVVCVCSRQIITSSSQEARKSSTTTFAFSSFETREAIIVYLVFAQRRRGQAALAASSLCRSEQRRGCDLTAASFCPLLSRGIIVID